MSPSVVTQTLVACKPEELVLDYAPTRRGPELLQGCRRDRPSEVVGRIRGAGVAPKRVGRAVKTVGARLDPNGYDRALLPAIFRLGVLLGIEFLDRIDGQE